MEIFKQRNFVKYFKHDRKTFKKKIDDIIKILKNAFFQFSDYHQTKSSL